jgi:recombinational DNA repair protein RecT
VPSSPKKQEPPKPPPVYDEMTKKTIQQLREIFTHYSKQSINIRNEFTFEDIREEHELLNLNKVIAFLQDFNIAVPSQVCLYL